MTKLVFFETDSPETVDTDLSKKIKIVQFNDRHYFIPMKGYKEPLIVEWNGMYNTCNMSNEIYDAIINHMSEKYLSLKYDDNLKPYMIMLSMGYDEILDVLAFPDSDPASFIRSLNDECEEDFTLLYAMLDPEELDSFEESFIAILEDCDNDLDYLCSEFFKSNGYVTICNCINQDITPSINLNPLIHEIEFDNTVARKAKINLSNDFILLMSPEMFSDDNKKEYYRYCKGDNLPIILVDDPSSIYNRLTPRYLANDSSNLLVPINLIINTLLFTAIYNSSELYVNNIRLTNNYKIDAKTSAEFVEFVKNTILSNSNGQLPDEINIQICNNNGFTTIASFDLSIFNAKEFNRMNDCLLYTDEVPKSSIFPLITSRITKYSNENLLQVK